MQPAPSYAKQRVSMIRNATITDCKHTHGTLRCIKQTTKTQLSQRKRFQQCGMCDQQSLRSACAYAQSDQSLCLSLEYIMSVKLLTEQLLEFLNLKRGCKGSSESKFVKIPQLLEISCTGSIKVKQPALTSQPATD